MSKKKILLLSDHALSTSGVGTQSRHLIEGLLAKSNDFTFRQLGAAIKHKDYDVVHVNPDFIIKPIDGFGSIDMLRLLLVQEKPDLLMLFTDPRFFEWLFEIEDEIHQQCPIVWWHVWDNFPAPKFNKKFYESTDLINCISYLTYEACCELGYEKKTNYVPHALPNNLFFPLGDEEVQNYKKNILGPSRKDSFVGLWINRNARRKRPNDLLWAWKLFLNRLEETEGHRDAVLIMHTEPLDPEGPNLLQTVSELDLEENVVFSRERFGFDKVNVLHNISDFCVNISFAEGFGLPTLESMYTGNPIIAGKTGGQTRQVVDPRDGTHNGIAIDIKTKSLVGSQQVPYIYEDYVDVNDVADSFMKMYKMGPEGRKELGQKCRDYALEEFSFDTMINRWHKTLSDTHKNWEKNYKRWELVEI